MKIFDYTIKETADILAELKTDEKTGLSKKEAQERIKKYGFNELKSQKLSALKIFMRQFNSSFIYLLLVAMAITLALGEKADSFMIFIFLAINTVLGFYQEYRSEKTAQFLNKYSMPKARVLRDGKIETVLSKNLIPGDIIILETGDKIPADVRFIEQHNLTIAEEVLTGESVSIHKVDKVLDKKATAYFESLNLGFFGTDVLGGKAKAVVLATGKNTSFGKIAKLSNQTRHVSEFEKGISRFSKFILKLVGLTLVLVLAANLLVKGENFNFIELVVFFIALVISVIPEALPLVTTFSLSQGAKRLAENNVIVKRLSAVEDLGGIEILCTDKTGTLTENKLRVANFYSGSPEDTLIAANLAAAFDEKKKLEPFDAALSQELKEEQEIKLVNAQKIDEEPFNPKTKRNIVLVQQGSKFQLITRGAPEEVLRFCSNIPAKEKHNIEKWIKMEGEQGHRVLAVAKKDVGKDLSKDIDLEKEKNYDFLGVISFVDPIKKSSFKVVEKANKLGVKVKIITGDSIDVAGAVAHQIGLILFPTEVMTGADWEKLDEDKKIEALKNFSVFARVSPEQKYAMIETLQKNNVVGFLGEGINDAPALKIASVSIVVDSVTDVAREAADIILLKKNLAVILDGIEEGRKIFANTTKYIKSTLASNFGNFFAVATASLIVDFLPMLPIQILLLNLLSDSPMVSIATDTVDKEELVAPKKYEVKEIVLFSIVLGVLSTIFDFIFFALFFKMSPSVLQTNWFIGSILTELVLIFSIRTKSFFLKATTPSTPLLSLTIIAAFFTIWLPYSSFGQRVFHFTPPTLPHLALILSLVFVYFVCNEFLKLMFYKKAAK